MVLKLTRLVKVERRLDHLTSTVTSLELEIRELSKLYSKQKKQKQLQLKQLQEHQHAQNESHVEGSDSTSRPATRRLSFRAASLKLKKSSSDLSDMKSPRPSTSATSATSANPAASAAHAASSDADALLRSAAASQHLVEAEAQRRASSASGPPLYEDRVADMTHGVGHAADAAPAQEQRIVSVAAAPSRGDDVTSSEGNMDMQRPSAASATATAPSKSEDTKKDTDRTTDVRTSNPSISTSYTDMDDDADPHVVTYGEAAHSTALSPGTCQDMFEGQDEEDVQEVKPLAALSAREQDEQDTQDDSIRDHHDDHDTKGRSHLADMAPTPTASQRDSRVFDLDGSGVRFSDDDEDEEDRNPSRGEYVEVLADPEDQDKEAGVQQGPEPAHVAQWNMVHCDPIEAVEPSVSQQGEEQGLGQGQPEGQGQEQAAGQQQEQGQQQDNVAEKGQTEIGHEPASDSRVDEHGQQVAAAASGTDQAESSESPPPPPLSTSRRFISSSAQASPRGSLETLTLLTSANRTLSSASSPAPGSTPLSSSKLKGASSSLGDVTPRSGNSSPGVRTGSPAYANLDFSISKPKRREASPKQESQSTTVDDDDILRFMPASPGSNRRLRSGSSSLARAVQAAPPADP